MTEEDVVAPSSVEVTKRAYPGLAVGMAVLLMTGMVAATLPTYAGSVGAYIGFHLASAVLVVVSCLPPVSYGYATLALFLTLGFWVKTVTATMGLPVLIEPTGAFAQRPDQWDAALVMCAAGLVGVAVPKVVWFFRSRSARAFAAIPQVPAWYPRVRVAVWLATGVAIIASNIFNWMFSFYAVGVHPKLVLPLHLNVAVAWWLTVGSGMWLAVLLDLEHRRSPRAPFGRWLLIPVAEALLSTSVMLSRGFYLMKVLPYALVALVTHPRRSFNVSVGARVALALVAVAGFALSLVVVSWLRLMTYPPTVLADSPSTEVTRHSSEPAPGTPQTDVETVAPAASSAPRTLEPRQPSDAEISATTHQLTRMVLGRWIGLEGVLAVTSSEQASLSLLKDVAREDPNRGNDAVFQRMSQASYRAQPNFTFLTLPGVLAITAYSGSALVAAICMAFIACLVLGTEALFRRLFSNEFLCAVVGVAMANALAQMNFPYLTLVFFIELWGTLALLWVLFLVGRRLPIGGANRRRSSATFQEGDV